MKIVVVLFSLMLLTVARAESNVHVAYLESLQELRMAYAKVLPGAQKPGLPQLESLRFDAFGRHFAINLAPNHSLLNAAMRSALDDRLGIYRGEIDGMPGSWARLVIENDVPRGILWDGEQLWSVEVAENSATGTEQPFIFRLEDLQIAPGTMSCGDTGMATNAGELANAVLAEMAAMTALGPGATSQIDVAVIGDFEFTSDKGAGVDTALITRMNNVDGLFSAQLGVQININRIDSFASNNDPFTDATDSGGLLDELTDYRFATSVQNANGLTHLFTGRDLDTTTVGVAYTGALCSRRFGAGLTQGTHNVTTDSLIAAHEIGHNFGAPHDGTSGSACEAEPQIFLMAPQVNNSSTFSSCSITEIQEDVNGAACISPLPSTDVAMVAGSQPGSVLLGNPASFTLEANSVGTMTASGVVVNVTIPPSVSLSSVSASAGSCTSGAGNASCTIGSIAAGSGVTVSITAATLATGNADFVANVTAASDANSNNNRTTVRIAVNPAVDLVSIAAATAQVALDQRTTIRPRVENRSSIQATSVTVTVTPDAGLRIESASWAPGGCGIAGNAATCQAGGLAAQANETLQLELTGITAGNRSYTVSVSAAETERIGANNAVTGQVSVGSGSAVSGNESDGGGGSLGWLTLLLLAVRLRALRRERATARQTRCISKA